MSSSVLELPRVSPGSGPRHGRVLLVSNRLPVTAGGKASSGGLVSGLRQVARRWPVVWVGWDGVAHLGGPEREVVRPFERGSTVALSMTEEEVAGFYRRYCNGVLWPVLHGRIADVPADDEDWATYRAVNERFADVVMRQLRPGDRLWVHDYHLLLLPAILRARVPQVPVAFFLHTSFPEAEVFRTIPQAEELLSGLLAADSIGFHTSAYEANFLRTAAAMGRRIRGSAVVGERTAHTHVHPMGIDADAFEALARDADVLEDATGIRRGRGRLLLGVDRLDYTKGIPQRLLAFEMLLEKYPRLRGQVSFFQVAVPTREGSGPYRELRHVVEMLVRRINDRFGRSGWLPVDYLYGSVDLGSLAALYRAADVMVVTPVRDGLNLVAKEFVASRIDGDGVLVLSRYAGAADELAAALQVDPNKIGPLAETFRAALTMPTRERHRRMRSLRRAVAGNTVYDWAGDFLQTLDELAPGSQARLASPAPATEETGHIRGGPGIPLAARIAEATRLPSRAPAWAALPSPATT